MSTQIDDVGYITHIAVAKHFLALHKVDDIDLWRVPDWYKGDERYLRIYNNMLLGQYGLNDKSADSYVLTIPANESRSGLEVAFDYRGLE